MIHDDLSHLLGDPQAFAERWPRATAAALRTLARQVTSRAGRRPLPDFEP